MLIVGLSGIQGHGLEELAIYQVERECRFYPEFLAWQDQQCKCSQDRHEVWGVR